MKFKKALAMMMVCTAVTGTVLVAGAEETTTDQTTNSATTYYGRGGMRGQGRGMGMRGNRGGMMQGLGNGGYRSVATDEEIQAKHDAMVAVYAKLAGITVAEAEKLEDESPNTIMYLIRQLDVDNDTVVEALKEAFPDGYEQYFGAGYGTGRGRGGMRGGYGRGMGRGVAGGYGLIAEAYAEVAGITTEEALELCQDTSKTLYDLAEEKGLTDELKAKITELRDAYRSKFISSTTNEDL